MRQRLTSRSLFVAAALNLVTGVGAPSGVALAGPNDPANLLKIDLSGLDDLEGAVVHLYQVMSSVPDADYDLEPIAQGVTDAAGKLTLEIQGTKQLVLDALENSGFVNFQLIAHAYEQVQEGDVLGAAMPATDVIYTGGDLLYGSLKDAGVFGPGDEVQGMVLALPDVVSLELTAVSTLDAATGSPSGSADAPKCENYAPDREVVSRTAPMEPFGELHTYYDMSARIEYGATANTDLWGGFQVNSGPWKVTTNANHMGQKYSAGVHAFRGHHFGRVFNTQFA